MIRTNLFALLYCFLHLKLYF